MPFLNISSKSDDPRARRLSNFSADRFILQGKTFASVEGFIQGTKFPEGNPNREKAFRSVGIAAKRFGKKAARKFVWWRGRQIPYAGSEHRRLIEEAIMAKFVQNPGALQALLATEEMTLTHDIGEPEPPDTSLPAALFCSILMKIRNEYS